MKGIELEEKLNILCHKGIINNREKQGIILAREAFKCSPYQKIKIGATIMLKKRPLGIGFNQKKTHPKQQKYNALRDEFNPVWKGYLHAEMDALRKVEGEDLKDAVIYVYRELHDGTLGICRPCKACMEAIKKAGIRTIVYTNWDGNICKEVVF